MKKSFWLPVVTIATALTLTACLKNDDDVVQCTPNSLGKDQMAIDSFISANNIAYLNYNTGYGAYYGISSPGSGNTAAADSIVALKRTISVFNGDDLIAVTTDSIYLNGTNTKLRLSDFQATSPLFSFLSSEQEGARLRMIFPSSAHSLGFLGCQRQTLNNGIVIPANSQVIQDFIFTGLDKAN